MNGKMKAALKRMLVLIFSVVLLLGGVSYYAPSYVQAGDWSGEGVSSGATYINLEGGDWEGLQQKKYIGKSRSTCCALRGIAIL